MGKSEDFFGINVYGGSCYGHRNTLDVSRSYADGKPFFIFEINVMPPNAQVRTAERVRTQLWSMIVGGARGIFIVCMDPNPPHSLLSDQSLLPSVRPEYVRFTQTVNKFGEILALPNESADIAVLYSTTAALHYPNGLQWPGPFNDAYSLVRNSHYNMHLMPIVKMVEGSSPSLIAWNVVRLLLDNHARPPACLGLKTRANPIGNRINQKITLCQWAPKVYQAWALENRPY